MAWWPFGKKKGSEGGDAAAAEPGATPGGDAESAPTIPPSNELTAPAPTILVPPEFGQGVPPPTDIPFSAEMPTLAPNQVRDQMFQGGGPDPFGAPGGAFAAPGDPFAVPGGGGDPFGAGDPFAQPGAPQDFSKTLEDPDSPKQKKRPPIVKGGPPPAPIQSAHADPFAAPSNRNDFALTVGDPDGEDQQQTLPPPPFHPGHGHAGPAQDLFASAEPHEQTMKMPGPPVRGAPPQRPAPAKPGTYTYGAPPATPPVSAGAASPANDATFTAPPQPQAPPLQPSAAHEETPMLAKTVALTPDKRRLGLALLAGGPITQERLQEELEKSGKSQSVLGKALLKSNFPKEEELLAALVSQIRIPKINVRNTKIPLETIKIVPAEVAKRWKVLAIERIGDILVVVSPGIGEEEALASVRKATGCSVFPFQCDAEGFEDVLEGYYERLAASGLAAAPPAPANDPFAAPGPAPRPVAASAPAGASGPLAALPADGGGDEWERIYAAAGPVPAEEVLL